MAHDLSPLQEPSELLIREYQTDDERTYVIDFGTKSPDLQVDVVDDTLIVIDDAADDHYELSLPAGEARTFMQNGVLTLEVKE